MKSKVKILLIAIIGFTSLKVQAQAFVERTDVKAFATEVSKQHDLNKKNVLKNLAQVEIRQDIIDLMNKPAEKVKPWYEYKKIFLTDKRVNGGVAFWQKNKESLLYAHEVYGVPEEIIVAIIGVETFYGRIKGRHRVIDALATLTFEYPSRAKFFRNELKQFLLLCDEQAIDPLQLIGSYAGAMGMGQFMPSSYRNYAVNFDGKGIVDIWENSVDAIGSVANYFKQHGWEKEHQVIFKIDEYPKDMTKSASLKPKKTIQQYKERGISSILSSKVGDEKVAIIELEEKDGFHYWFALNNFYVITRYNHSPMYAMAVYLLSQEIKKSFSSNAQ